MTCRYRELLHRHGPQAAPAEHLRQCPPCAALADRLRRAQDILQRQSIEIEPGLEHRLREGIRRRESSAHRLTLPVAAAFAVGAAALLLWAPGPPPPRAPGTTAVPSAPVASAPQAPLAAAPAMTVRRHQRTQWRGRTVVGLSNAELRPGLGPHLHLATGSVRIEAETRAEAEAEPWFLETPAARIELTPLARVIVNVSHDRTTLAVEAGRVRVDPTDAGAPRWLRVGARWTSPAPAVPNATPPARASIRAGGPITPRPAASSQRPAPKPGSGAERSAPPSRRRGSIRARERNQAPAQNRSTRRLDAKARATEEPITGHVRYDASPPAPRTRRQPDRARLPDDDVGQRANEATSTTTPPVPLGPPANDRSRPPPDDDSVAAADALRRSGQPKAALAAYRGVLADPAAHVDDREYAAFQAAKILRALQQPRAALRVLTTPPLTWDRGGLAPERIRLAAALYLDGGQARAAAALLARIGFAGASAVVEARLSVARALAPIDRDGALALLSGMDLSTVDPALARAVRTSQRALQTKK